jgi:hypothetical protein
MAEVYINSNDPVSTKIFYSGEIIDADGQVTATVYDITEDSAITPPIDPTTALLTFNATKLDNDFGTYQISIPFSVTDRQRKLKVNWAYQINGTNVNHNQYVDVVVPYCNFGNALEDLGFGTDPSDPKYKTYHDLKMAEKYARKQIEDYTGQEFYLYTDTEVVYGNDSDILPLPYKIHEIHQVYANDILLIDNLASPAVNNWIYVPQISESGFGIRIDRTDLLDNTVYVANGMVPPTINDTYTGQAFAKNVRYKVVGKYGWEDVPDNVEQACINLMGHFFEKDRYWKDQYIKSVQTFDWQVEYTEGIYAGTGCSYADKLLSNYVLNQMVVI